MNALDRPLRVLVIGRHFWPQGAIDSAGHLMELATGLKLAGLHVSVLTPKYSSAWAEKFSFREFNVYRPVRIFRTGWTARGDRTASRYIRYLREWIESNHANCDVIFCVGCREEVIAAVEAAHSIGVPSVVRIAGHGSCSDFEFFGQHRIGKRCRAAVHEADAVVLCSASDERRWIVDGGQSGRAHRIEFGIGSTQDHSLSGKENLRRAMSRINGDLFVPETSTVVLSVERLRRDTGVMTLVQSAYALSQSLRSLQFWLVGDGPYRESIYSQLRADGLRQVIAIPGSFGVSEDVFAAADLMVHVGDEGFEHQIPAAIAAGLPLVIANTKTAREFFGVSEADVDKRMIQRRRDVTGDDGTECGETTSETAGDLLWWFDPGRPKTLRFAIAHIISDMEAARDRARQLRRILQRTRPRSAAIEHYVRLFRQLVDASSRKKPDPTKMENTR